MRLAVLRGFGRRRHNPLVRYFEHGYFPQSKWSWFGTLNDWRQDDSVWLLLEFRKRFGRDPYVLIGFSDGGTLAHELAAADPCCAGLIVHSGLWRNPPWLTDAPTLLLRTRGDRTPTYEATEKAFESYDEQGKQVAMETLDPWPDLPFNHQFGNGLLSMRRWCRDELGFELPVAERAIA